MSDIEQRLATQEAQENALLVDDDPASAVAASNKRQAEERQLFQEDVDVERLVLHTVGKSTPDLNVAGSLTSGEVLRTIEGASELTLTIHDLGRAVLRSGMLQDAKGRLRAVDVKLDGLNFRTAKVEKSGDDLLLTLEERDIARLRRKKGPRVIGARSKITRAQAILILIRSIKARPRIKYRIHELKKKQPIRGATKSQRRQERDRRRSKGFESGARLQGKEGYLNSTQLNNASTVISIADDLNAPDLATLALIEACMVEGPDFKNPRGGDGTSVGILQLTQGHGSVEYRRNIEKVVTRFLKGPSFTGAEGGKGAIALARAHSDWSPGKIAQTIQGSGFPSRYDLQRRKARQILDAWGSTAGKATVFKKYEFKVNGKDEQTGRPENYWEAIQRMADEVHWRAFFVGDTFHYISEHDLYESRARFKFSEDTPGIINVDFSQDSRKRIDKATVTCRINRWGAPPGTTVILQGLGTANGKWLVLDIRRSLFSSEAEINLIKPAKELGEPRADVKDAGPGAADQNVGLINTDGGAKGIVDQVVVLAQTIGGPEVYVGSRYRPGSKITSGSNAGQPDDHSQNNATRSAADIGVRGIDLITGPPSPHLDKAIVAIGNAFDRDYNAGHGKKGKFQQADTFNWGDYRIQIIYRTPNWGGHMGHIHFGVRFAGKYGPPTPVQKPIG